MPATIDTSITSTTVYKTDDSFTTHVLALGGDAPFITVNRTDELGAVQDAFLILPVAEAQQLIDALTNAIASTK